MPQVHCCHVVSIVFVDKDTADVVMLIMSTVTSLQCHHHVLIRLGDCRHGAIMQSAAMGEAETDDNRC